MLIEGVGGERFRNVIRDAYYTKARCVVFVIDGSSPPAKFSKSDRELRDAFWETNLPFIVVVTKMDLPEPLLTVSQVAAVIRELAAEQQERRCVTRQWCVLGVSSKSGRGIAAVRDWISACVLGSASMEASGNERGT